MTTSTRGGYTQLKAIVTGLDADALELLSDALAEVGALSVDFADADEGTPEESPLFDEPGIESDNTAAGWARLTLTALFPDGVDAEAAQAAYDMAWAALESVHRTEATGKKPSIKIEHIDDEDWVRITQAQFSPIEISPKLWIVPSWHDVRVEDAINIRLDPGVAFGTGSHPTTHMCLRWLSEIDLKNKYVLDYGTGSGILAIAAGLLGARQLVGVDIDPQAIEAAKYNAQINNITAEFYTTEVAVKPAQITVANILSKPLMVLAPFLATHTLPGGQIALAGILTDQAEEVAASYAPWFDIAPHANKDGWTLLVGKRRF